MTKHETKDALALMEEALQKMNDSVDELRGVVTALREGDLTVDASKARKRVKSDAVAARTRISDEATVAQDKIEDDTLEARHTIEQAAADQRDDPTA